MSYEELDQVADLDWTKMDLTAPSEFEKMLTEHLTNIEVYDPEVGSIFDVDSLEVVNNKLCAILSNDVVVEMNLATEYRCLLDSIFQEGTTFKNRKEFLKYVSKNKETINEAVKKQKLKIQITKTRNGILEGSISAWNFKKLSKEFLEQIRLNKIIESSKKKFTKSRNPIKTQSKTGYSYDEVEEAKQNQRYYKCKLVEMNKGGFLGYISGVQVFVPGSLAHHQRIEDYESFVGKTIDVMIDSYVSNRNIFIASNKRYIDAKIPTIVNEIDNNTKQTGTITGITDFGIFINFKEILNGLLHISEMTQNTIHKLKNREFEIGEEVEFYVKSFYHDKIVLSEMTLEEAESEWEEIENDIKGTVVLGKVLKKVSTGYLFKLDNGLRGLLYDIEADKYPMNIVEGNEYEVEVWKMDFNSSKIFLKYPEIQNLQELRDAFIPK
jgi:small subunit ribosomal protein S1